MEPVTKQEFNDWYTQEITQQFLKDTVESANHAAAEILNRATVDVARDQFLKGMMAAFSEVCSWKPDLLPDSVVEAVEGANDAA